MSTLQWNGRYLGEVSRSMIHRRIKENGRTWWKLTIESETIYAEVKRIKDIYPIFVDEVINIFTEVKIGTHYVFYCESMYMLMKTDFDDEGSIVSPAYLHTYEIDMTSDIVEKIRSVFVLRILLRLKASLSRLQVMGDGRIVSCPDKIISDEDEMRDRRIWFPDDTFGETVRRLFGKYGAKSEDIQGVVKGKMKKMISRIDKDLIIYVDDFLERMDDFIRLYFHH